MTKKSFLFYCLFILLTAFSATPLFAATLPANFAEQAIGGTWNEAAGLTFASDGRMYVWERGGRVWIMENGVKSSQPFLDISDEVGGWRDFGLLGFALHPDFYNNGYVYLLYVVDHYHLTHAGQPGYDPTINEYFQATIGRITRYTARASDGFRSIDPASRLVLLGESIDKGIPILHESHGVGSLAFGMDGTLLASCGDGASYNSTDVGSASETYYSSALSQGIIKPKENVGAFRSQMVDSLNGKILRLDPATGDGLPSNPWFDAANPRAPHSRVWALGLRNPCRINLRPGTGSHNPADANPGVIYIGDVGWNTWEDLNVCTRPGMNFGWPAFEGMDVQSSYYNSNTGNQDAPNPLYGIGGCTQRYFYFRDLIVQDTLATPSWPNPCNTAQQVPASIPHFVHSRPWIDWKHSTGPSRTAIYNGTTAASINVGAAGSPVSGPQFPGNCSIGGVWYLGSDFPSTYYNTYFHCDYGEGWIKNFVFDSNNKPVAVRDFLSAGGGVMFATTDPINGGLYYISWSSTIRKISYTGNQPPTAVATVNRNYGPAPLTVQFTGSNSKDPENLPLTYAWTFGDGSTSSAANPSHTFNAPAGVPTRFDVKLRVTDAGGLFSETNLIISANNTPPSVVITSPVDGTLYPMTADSSYNCTANVSDAEQGPGGLSCAWQTILHHNNHIHTEPIDPNCSTTTTISPAGCDGNTYFYSVQLTVTDSAGLSTTAEVRLYPDCQNLPPGISAIADQTINEDTATGPLSFTIGDAETPASNLLLTGSSSNPVLVPNANIIFGGSGSNRTVNVQPAANQTGATTITVTVSDGTSTASTSFNVNVNAVNDPPTISNIPDQTITQNTSTGPINFTVGDAETVASSLVVSGSSSNPTLVPNANIVFGGSGANRTVNVTSAAGQTGTATITVTVSDGSLTASDAFVLAVNSSNAPTYLLTEGFEGTGFENTGWINHGTANPDYTAVALHGAQSLNCVGVQYIERPFAFSTSFYLYLRVRWNTWGDYNNVIYWDDPSWNIVAGLYADHNRLELNHGTANSFGTTTIAPNTTYHVWVEWTKGTGANGTMKLFLSTTGVKPAAPEANITTGNGGATARMYVGPTSAGPNAIFDRILVDDVPIGNISDTISSNTPPVISDITDRSTPEDTSTGAISFTVGDAETAASSLVVSGSSSNPTLVPNANIVFGGSGSNRTVSILPAANQSGSATITVNVSDGSLTTSDTFVLTVTPVNDPPTISDIPDQTIVQGGSAGPISFTVGDVETAAGSLVLTGSSSNPTLVPNTAIVFGGSGANRTITVTPASNQSGSATITVTVSDGSATASDTFLLTVTPASNTPPVISDIADQTTAEDTSTGPISFTVGDAETAASGLVVSGSSSNPTLVPNASIAFGGSGANRTVSILPAANQSGSATITVTVSDGTATTSDTFVLTVTPVNDPPTISNIPDQTTAHDTPTPAISFTVGDIDTPVTSLTLSGSSANQSLVPNANIVFGGSGANRTVQITPAPGQNGTAAITITVSDGSSSATDTFVLTVTPPPPPFSAANINFQPASAPPYPGYLVDGGAVFGDRGNGLSYGWSVDNSPYMIDRNSGKSPDQRYDTLCQMQQAGNANQWEIAVPNGNYDVNIVAGDAAKPAGSIRINVENVLVVSGDPSPANRWITGRKTVAVTDGRLTVTNGAGANNNKICFIEITKVP